MQRRQFLLTSLAAPSMASPQSAGALLDRGFACVSELAPGVHVTIADPSKGVQCGSNGGVIAGRNAVLIVEGHMQPAGAALEVEVAKMVSKAPIRGAVDTHFHYDHTFGNLTYAERRIPILAHEKVGPLMKEQYAAAKSKERQSLLAPWANKVTQAADAIDRKHKEEDLEFASRMYDAIEKTTLAYPTEPFAPAQLPKGIDLGGLTATLEFHPGHSPTDLIVRVPAHDIVFTGDLLFHQSYPVAIDADMVAWRKVLDRFASYGSRTQFIPGHGPVCGQSTVREQCAVFDDLQAHAEKMIGSGASAEEAARTYRVPERFRDFRISGWGFRVGAAMQSYFTKLLPPHTARQAPTRQLAAVGQPNAVPG